MIKRKAISLMIVVAMVISMLPLGALTAFAAGTTEASPTTAPSINVVAGLAGDPVRDQVAGDITFKESSSAKNAWSSVDTDVAVDLPDNVTFSTKPTVKLNDSTVSTTLTNGGNTLTFKVFGTSDKQDIVTITGIKLDVANAAGSEVVATIADPEDDDDLSVKIAKIKGGVILEALETIEGALADIKLGENGQKTSDLKISESKVDVLKDGTKVSIVAPSGATFFQPPVASNLTAGFVLKSNIATLSDDRKTATWEIDTAVNATAESFTIDDPKINLDSTFAADTDITFTITTSDSGIAVAPSAGEKVAKSSAGDALSFSTTAAPNVSKSANQAVANITITENKADTLDAETVTVTILSDATFAGTPQMTPSGGLKLKDSDGNGVATTVAGKLSSDFKTATWIITDKSTSAGAKLDIKNLVLNVNVSSGAVKVQVGGEALDTTKDLTVANVAASANVTVTSAPLVIKKNAADQKAGDITITEAKKDAIKAGTLTFEIFGVSADDKEIKFAELPTFSVTSGDLDLGVAYFENTTTASKIVLVVDAVSTSASTVKVTDIRYDVSAKAIDGSVQVIVTNNTTRLAAVSNATIGAAAAGKFSDVPATHWAFNAVEYLASQNIVSGRTSGAYDPNGSVTRAEFAKMAVLAAGLSTVTTASPSFSDIKGHWAEGYIEAAKKAGIIGGYADGTFRPNAKITRAEIAKIVVGAAKFTMVSTGATFSDVTGHWAHHEIITAAVNKVVSGYPDGTFKPNNSATRAEAAQMIYKWLVK